MVKYAGNQKKKVNWWRISMLIVRGAIVLIVAGAIVLNVSPYVEFMRFLFEPVLGWIPSIYRLVTVLLGFMLWVLLQFLELLPSMLTRDRDTIELILSKIENHDYLSILDSDNPLVASLKQKYNDMPTKFLVDARKAKAIAYVIDFLICIFQYPPIDGGLSRIGVFLMAPSLGDINWVNLGCVAITLFTVEVLYWLYQWLGTGGKYLFGSAK